MKVQKMCEFASELYLLLPILLQEMVCTKNIELLVHWFSNVINVKWQWGEQRYEQTDVKYG